MPTIGVLIVDDQEDVRFLIRSIIESANRGLFVTGEAEDGSAALEAIDATDPEVVILDEMMPGMNGIQTASCIFEMRPNQRVLLCTAYLTEELRAKAAETGIRICIGKDEVFDLPELMRDLVAES